MELENAMKQAINRCRNEIKRPTGGGWHNVVGYRGPGDAGYLPPIEDFVTIRFHNGILVMPAEEFKKLSKAKQKKLMKW